MSATRPHRIFLIFSVLLGAVLFGLYALGLNNQLIFDDSSLANGNIFQQYGALWPLKPRIFSYGSFVWVDALWPQNWPVQRLFNTLLHLLAALSLAALIYQLLKLSDHWTAEHKTPDFDAKLMRASAVAAALWALHPVAVYGVGYLIQRSIVMATLFTTLALLTTVMGLKDRRPLWYVATAIFYVMALAAKEYAITFMLLLPLVYIYVRRPSLRQVAISVGIALVLLGLAAALFFKFYGSIVGQVFDETSRAFAAQLEQVQPGIGQDLYPLSILNQASLFWRYGLNWLVPLPSLMAIDIRPAFPLQWIGIELLGALAYLALIGASLWALIWREGAWRLIGLALLMPSMLFMTEFATVWIQDPYVLYRSYLWSIGWPILLALLLAYAGGKGLAAFAAIAGLTLSALSYNRIDSLYNARTVWADAAAKIDRHAPASAVGRWRPFINQGADALERGNYPEALQLFNQAVAYGEPLGSARMNLGVTLQQLQRHETALEQFKLAEAQGFTEAALYFHRGESLFALRIFDQAVQAYTQSLDKSQISDLGFMSRVRRAEAHAALRNYDAAVADYKVITAAKPDAQRYTIGLALSLNGQKKPDQALQILNQAIATRPTAAVHFARAMTYQQMGQLPASRADLAIALQAEPNNPAYQQLARQLQTPAAPNRP